MHMISTVKLKLLRDIHGNTIVLHRLRNEHLSEECNIQDVTKLIRQRTI